LQERSHLLQEHLHRLLEPQARLRQLQVLQEHLHLLQVLHLFLH
jgi:hypothetical protein